MACYGSLKTAYSQPSDDFLVSNPDFCITVAYIPKICCNTYLKVITLQNAVNDSEEHILSLLSAIISGMKIFSNPWQLIIKLSKTPNCQQPLKLHPNHDFYFAIPSTANYSSAHQQPQPTIPKLTLNLQIRVHWLLWTFLFFLRQKKKIAIKPRK